MRDLNPTIYGVNAVILNWYDIIVFVMLGISLFGVFWIFYDSQRKNVEPLIWKTLMVIAIVFLVPSVTVAVDERIAQNVIQAIPLLAYLGIFASFISIVSILGYLAKIGYDSGYNQYPTTDSGQHTVHLPQSTPWEETPSPVNMTTPIPPPIQTRAGVADNNIKTEFYNKNKNPDSVAPFKPPKTELLSVEPEEIAYLMVNSGSRKGKDYRLGTVVTIGRDAQSDILLNDDTLCSTQHAKVKLNNGQFTIYDLDSTNGTLVNNTKIDKYRLEDKDQITIGKTKFVFVQVRTDS